MIKSGVVHSGRYPTNSSKNLCLTRKCMGSKITVGIRALRLETDKIALVKQAGMASGQITDRFWRTNTFLAEHMGIPTSSFCLRRTNIGVNETIQQMRPFIRLNHKGLVSNRNFSQFVSSLIDTNAFFLKMSW